MKNSLLLLASLLLSFPVLAVDYCNGGAEAQGFFIVNSVRPAGQQCVVNVSIDWSKGDYAFRENPNCPLDTGDVQNADLIESCQLKAGESISGIMVLRDGKLHLE